MEHIELNYAMIAYHLLEKQASRHEIGKKALPIVSLRFQGSNARKCTAALARREESL